MVGARTAARRGGALPAISLRRRPIILDRQSWCVPIRIEDGGSVGYGGWGIFGMYVHNLSDVTKPRIYGHVVNDIEGMDGIPFHVVSSRCGWCTSFGGSAASPSCAASSAAPATRR